jgi:hypothetical protein
MTGSDAAPAKNAFVRFVIENRIGVRRAKESGTALKAKIIFYQVLFEGLKFTVQIFDTGAAIGLMTGKHEFHRHPARIFNLAAFGAYDHPVFGRSRTGCLQTFPSVDLDNA